MSINEGGTTAGEEPQASADASAPSGQATVQSLLDYLNDYRVMYRAVSIGSVAMLDEYRITLTAGDASGPLPDSWHALPVSKPLAEAVGLQQLYLPLNNLYAKMKWAESLPSDMLHFVEQDGNYYQVPVEVHRGNVLWYNPNVLRTAGVNISEITSIDSFLEAARRLRSVGAVSLCIADESAESVAQLFENAAVSALGKDKYSALWNGSLSAEDTDLVKAVDVFRHLVTECSPEGSMSESDARNLMISGKCAFLAAPSFTYRQFVEAGLEEGADFGWMAFPGTEEVFVAMANAYSLLAGVTDQASEDRLIALVSKDFQQRIVANGISICVRTDYDCRSYNAYQKWESDAYLSKVLVPSYSYGAAALTLSAELLAKLGEAPCQRWVVDTRRGRSTNVLFCCWFGLPCCCH